jgi:hypothetical protein
MLFVSQSNSKCLLLSFTLELQCQVKSQILKSPSIVLIWLILSKIDDYIKRT